MLEAHSESLYWYSWAVSNFKIFDLAKIQFSIAIYRDNVNVTVLTRNVKVIVESLARIIFNLPPGGAQEIFTQGMVSTRNCHQGKASICHQGAGVGSVLKCSTSLGMGQW